MQDEQAFWSEYQNEPQARDDDAAGLLTADDIQTRLNSLKAGLVPLNADYLTMLVDVQKELLFYVVAAWERDFTGYVIDYGTWPGPSLEPGSRGRSTTAWSSSSPSGPA